MISGMHIGPTEIGHWEVLEIMYNIVKLCLLYLKIKLNKNFFDL